MFLFFKFSFFFGFFVRLYSIDKNVKIWFNYKNCL